MLIVYKFNFKLPIIGFVLVLRLLLSDDKESSGMMSIQ